MDFDQMLESWKAQEEAPLYGVNRDLLQLVLQNEQAKIRRSLRRDQWITYLVGPGMALFLAFWLWVAILRDEPFLNTAAAALGTGVFVLWVGALWLSRRRQARRERSFGNTLQAEVRRNLSLVEYQLSIGGRWSAAMLWSAPGLVGGGVLYWLMAEINDNTDFWFDFWILAFLAWTLVFPTYVNSRAVKKKLEPRRQRLRELLRTLDAGE
jgi:hypothetical protein